MAPSHKPILCAVCGNPIDACTCGIVRSRDGWLYILHFTSLIGNPANTRALAGHYTGWTYDPEERDAKHRAGEGAALTRAAVERGVDWTMYVLGPGAWGAEKALKRLKAGPRLCPICGRRHPRGQLHVVSVYQQLALDLAVDPFDVPAPRTRWDWYEINYYRERPVMRYDIAEGGDIPW
jgi:hypothetical protein